ncbi:MAG: hypothetical protein P4L67_04750 [Candidatus Pacebacteria bacterium]|nr:hypothetical protein [Candidatus Paceibacterota bacterium]
MKKISTKAVDIVGAVIVCAGILFFGTTVIVLPSAAFIWCLNTLFGLAIPFDWRSILAVAVLYGYVRSVTRDRRKDS